MLLCGVLFWAASARRRSRRRWGITSPHLSFVPATFFSSAYGEVGVFCTGVQGQRFIVFAR